MLFQSQRSIFRHIRTREEITDNVKAADKFRVLVQTKNVWKKNIRDNKAQMPLASEQCKVGQVWREREWWKQHGK